MGIRVRCPNGHNLNLKESLAGHRGVCPHCGAKFTIPGPGEPPPVVTGDTLVVGEGTRPGEVIVAGAATPAPPATRGGEAARSAGKTPPPLGPRVPIVATPVRPVVRIGRRRRRGPVALVVWLTIAVMALVGVFVWVLLYR